MKVLVLHCMYQYKGGEEKVLEEEVRLLKDAGCDVQVLTFANTGRQLVKLLQLPFNLSSYRSTKKRIRKFNPDVIHVHNLHFAASPSVLYAAKHCGVPVVCTLHNYRLLCPSGVLFHNNELFLHSLNTGFPWQAVKKGVYKNSRVLTCWMALSDQLHRWIGTWQLPAQYIVLTRHAKTIMQASSLRIGEEKLTVKPNFCSNPEKNTAQRTDEFLFVGRLSVEKGVHLLLDFFANSPHRLAIAGDGPMRAEVEAVAATHSNIRYAGLLQKEELATLMQQASALLFPSIWYEGMPLTIIEAFANGLPVIASRLGAMEQMVTPFEDGLLFEAGNKPSLKQAIDHWCQLSIRQKEAYGHQARKTYETHYTPEKNVAQLIAIYTSVQSNTPQAAPAFR